VLGLGLALACAGGTLLGAAGAALRTGVGRDVLVRFGLDALNRRLDGVVAVGSVTGSFLGGLDAHDLVLQDSAGHAIVRIARARLRYRVRDLLDGRVVLGQLRLTEPVVTLTQDPGGGLDLERVLRLNRPGGSGRPPLIAFRDVEITSGAVAIHTREGTPPHVVDRTITDLDARLTYARLSSPLPGEHGMQFDLVDLTAQVSDPAVDLRGARGSVLVRSDTVSLNLSQARLPASTARVRGTVSWSTDRLQYALDVSASHVTTDDLRWIMPKLPVGLVGRGDATVHSASGDVLDVTLTHLALAGAGGAGAVRGTLGLVLGPGQHRTLVETDLVADSLDLDYVRPLLDTLPLAGWLTGRLQADGPEEQVHADLDWTFRDSLVPGWPVSHVAGDGGIALGGPGGLAFQDFAVRSAQLAMGTVRRLVPLDLLGRLEAAGTLNGPWKQVEFSGSLRHRQEDLPSTLARGVLRVDARGDTLGLWANLSLDSLQLDGLRPSYPAIGVGGAFAGDVRLAGYLDSLTLHAQLTGPGGEVTGDGAVFLLGPRRGAHWLDARFARLNLHGLDAGLPRTELDGQLRGSARLDTLTAPRAQGRLDLVRSVVGGTALDSLRARVTLADGVLVVDTLGVWGPELAASARGGMGVVGDRSDTLRVAARADSVGVLEPLARWLEGRGVAGAAPSGAATLNVTFAGSLSRFGIAARFSSPALIWGPLRLHAADVTGRWHSTERGVVELDGTVDSLGWGSRQFSGVEGHVRGRRDSLAWFARSEIGAYASWVAGGTMRSDSARSTIVIDSLGLLLPSEAWALRREMMLVWRDSSLDVDSTVLASASGAARVTVAGRLPFRGSGDFGVSLEGVPLPDVWALLQDDPADVAGTVSGTVRLHGTAADPLIGGKAALRDAVFRGFRAPYVDGTFSYVGQRLGGDFGLWRGGQRIMGITLDLPVDLALRGAPANRELPGPLSIRVRADSVDLAFVGAMVPVAQETSGRLSADVGIAGSWTSPRLTGDLSLHDGAVTFPALGVRHRDLFGHLSLSADTIRVDTLSLASGDGTATVHGYVRLAQLTRPLLHLRIRTRDFRVVDVRDYLSFTASGDVALEGPVHEATLTGRDSVPRGVLYFTDLLEKQVINLEDTRYADIIDTSLVRRQGLQEPFQNRFLDSLRIDSLVLNMGSDAWLRSNEANIQLTGALTVNKDANRYRLVGTLQTPRGTYRLPLTTTVKSEFTVTRGQLQYFGTPDLNATVDIDARHVVRRPDQNINVAVHIGGTLYTPRLTLTSDIRPPIPETEIISLLLFGTSSVQALAQGSNNQNLLNTAVSTFSGYAAAAVSGEIERSLITDLGVPLDFLQIRPGDVTGGRPLSGTQIAVGKQVDLFGLPTFITWSPRLCPQQTGPSLANVSAEMRLGRQWALDVSRDPVGSCTGLISTTGSTLRYQFGFDLFWERVY
jgi:autotransporter translocation and assembly factor TamB